MVFDGDGWLRSVVPSQSLRRVSIWSKSALAARVFILVLVSEENFGLLVVLVIGLGQSVGLKMSDIGFIVVFIGAELGDLKFRLETGLEALDV